jgi:hypothetical protein
MMTPRQHLGIGTALLSLDEFPVDMVLGDELLNRIENSFGHGYRFDQIGAGFGEGFSLRGIGGHRRKSVRPRALRWTQHDPDAGRAEANIVAIPRRLGTVEIDGGAAGIIECRLILLAQHRPWLHLRLIRQHADAAPDKSGPRRVRLAALDHHAQGNAQ